MLHYLSWARETADWLENHPQAYNLFSSAITTPHHLMRQQLNGVDLLPLLTEGGKMSASWGHPDLRRAISERYGIDDPARVLAAAGASSAYVLVVRALVQPGDHVVIESPVYEPFVSVVRDQGAQITFVERRFEDAYALDLDALAAVLTPQTRLIVLSSLHNPGGALLDVPTLEQIAALARRAGARVLVDEIYRDLAGDAGVCAAVLDPETFITISSATKAYGLGAIRAGWIVTPPDLLPALRDVHVVYECSLSPYTQALAALFFAEHYAAYHAHAMQILAVNRPVMLAAFDELRAAGLIAGEMPQYGCVAFPKIPGVADTAALAQWLRDEHGVVTAPGEFFRAPGHLRIGFGNDPAALAASLAALHAGLTAYQPIVAGTRT